MNVMSIGHQWKWKCQTKARIAGNLWLSFIAYPATKAALMISVDAGQMGVEFFGAYA